MLYKSSNSTHIFYTFQQFRFWKSMWCTFFLGAKAFLEPEGLQVFNLYVCTYVQVCLYVGTKQIDRYTDRQIDR